MAAAATTASATTLWPQPQSLTIEGSGISLLSKNFKFSYGTESSSSDVLDEAFMRYTRIMKPMVSPSSGDLSTCTVTVADSSVPLTTGVDESYSITVGQSVPVTKTSGLRAMDATITPCAITAATTWGALRAIDTFSQLVTVDVESNQRMVADLPLSIQDFPRFGHRGILIDSARHFLPVSAILSTIDALSFNKMNVLHWHIIDAQSIPINTPSAPRMVEGAYTPAQTYTMEEISKVVDYGRSRGVVVELEVDIPGHAYAWGKGYPEATASCPSYEHNVNNIPLNPAKEEAYDLVGAVLSDLTNALVAGGSADTAFHVGGDEVVYNCWAQDPVASAWKVQQGWSSWDDAMCYFVDRVADTLQSLGRSPVYWEEVFLAGCNIRSEAAVQVWISQEMMTNVTAAGHKTIASPQNYWYLDHSENDWKVMYGYEPTANMTETQANLVLGGEACMWGEKIYEGNLHGMVWPRTSAVAERLWSDKAVTDTTTAYDRIQAHRCRMTARGIASAPLSPGFCVGNLL